MDSSGYQGVALNAALLFIGLIVSVALTSFIALSKRHSFRGFTGAALFFLILLLSVSLTLAITNFSWDVMLIQTFAGNLVISIVPVYPLTLFLIHRIFARVSRSSAASIQRALLIVVIAILALAAAWCLAER